MITDLFTVYPNPSTGVFNVQFPVALQEDMQVSIFDVIGKVIKIQTFEKGNQTFTLDIAEFAKGMYLLRFNQDGATYSKSIILE
ncbi:T9SS type A sorting domain-containing protein [Bernardetia sp. OM2101]|uniref:T9SS type A sorting domain-containing protein n=1 Tax=Bernardetia sp. OM2101 TaxID=3344876 RepID=UPI0035CFCDF3